jgi:hypothetical protein
MNAGQYRHSEMNSMKTRKRLTREESKEVTRMRLIEPAERLFIRRGFDNALVDQISEVAGYSRADRPEIVALALLAVAHGLGSLAIETEPEWENTYTEAAKLVFDRVTAPKSLTEGKSQC